MSLRSDDVRLTSDSHASIYVKSLASGPTRVFLNRGEQPRSVGGGQSGEPEANLLDAMLLPDTKRVVLKPREQIGHTPGDGSVDTKLVDHLDRITLNGFWCKSGQ